MIISSVLGQICTCLPADVGFGGRCGPGSDYKVPGNRELKLYRIEDIPELMHL